MIDINGDGFLDIYQNRLGGFLNLRQQVEYFY